LQDKRVVTAQESVDVVFSLPTTCTPVTATVTSHSETVLVNQVWVNETTLRLTPVFGWFSTTTSAATVSANISISSAGFAAKNNTGLTTSLASTAIYAPAKELVAKPSNVTGFEVTEVNVNDEGAEDRDTFEIKFNEIADMETVRIMARRVGTTTYSQVNVPGANVEVEDGVVTVNLYGATFGLVTLNEGAFTSEDDVYEFVIYTVNGSIASDYIGFTIAFVAAPEEEIEA